MTFVADLHIHSRYSRATSQELCFEQLYAWGRRKGLSLIGTGDCTHPGWLAEIREKLLSAGDGVFRLREELIPAGDYPPLAEDVRFLLTGEISTIYKAGGATRKVHHLVCLPDIEAAERFAARLERIGNIASDGRPILGLDSRDLLETLLEASSEAVLIPAHIWTPWFSVLGSKSGFDAVDDCYRDLAGHIFACETGLSSDPPMNWMVSNLDRYALVSNSDAHSPAKLGREANVFTCAVGYTAVMDALRRKAPGFWGTLEFFPEEGKYHFDGHRKCNFACGPEESKALGGRCPTCGMPLTLGVDYRVTELADRTKGTKPAGAFAYQSLLSLAEILGELLETGSTSKKVEQFYGKLLAEIGPELYILREAEPEQIRQAGGELLAIAIEKMRAGKVHATPGYDGEYGIIKVFTEEERAEVLGQIQLFAGLALNTPKKRAMPTLAPAPALTLEMPAKAAEEGLSAEQRRAVEHPTGPLIITAGPGAGKTRTLVERIKWLVSEQQIAPESILALTFSNRAARELKERVSASLVPLKVSGTPTVATFHKLGFVILSEHAERLGLPGPLKILAEEEAEALFAEALTPQPPLPEERGRNGCVIGGPEELERALAEQLAATSGNPEELAGIADALQAMAPGYADRKRERGAVDFTDLLVLPLALLAGDAEIRGQYQARWPHVFVDEYQDVNVFQYLLLRLLCPAGGDLCAIGDPDQAIYGFRGADVRYFLRFREDYPGAGQVSLTRNYRSSQTIVQASTRVIARGGRRELWSDVTGPAQIEVAALPTPAAEAEFVVQTIEGLLGGISHFSVDSGRGGDGAGQNLGFGDIAVLYRTHALGEELQVAFQRSGIPFLRAARRDVFLRADVRKVLTALPTLAELPPTRAVLEACGNRGITAEALTQPPWTLLLRQAELTADVPALLQQFALERDIDIYDPRGARVALMTAHAAKGLEWDTVFLVGCEEGSFPHPAAPEDEERRLFYVGMTRARQRLYLTHAESRTQQGERATRQLSPFVYDIEAGLRNMTAPFADRPRKPRQTQLTLLEFEG